jgi:hypothetical protein
MLPHNIFTGTPDPLHRPTFALTSLAVPVVESSAHTKRVVTDSWLCSRKVTGDRAENGTPAKQSHGRHLSCSGAEL